VDLLSDDEITAALAGLPNWTRTGNSISRTVELADFRAAMLFTGAVAYMAEKANHHPDILIEWNKVTLTLSTHSAGSLYEAFPAPEAHRILRRLEFHYTPKHASWLNMVEIEIGVLRSQCLDRRIGELRVLLAQIAAWQRQRNNTRARIKWMFTTERARIKLAHAYPHPVKES